MIHSHMLKLYEIQCEKLWLHSGYGKLIISVFEWAFNLLKLLLKLFIIIKNRAKTLFALFFIS